MIGANVTFEHACPQNHTLTDIDTASEMTSAHPAKYFSRLVKQYRGTLTLELLDHTTQNFQINNTVLMNVISPDILSTNNQTAIITHISLNMVNITAINGYIISISPLQTPSSSSTHRTDQTSTTDEDLPYDDIDDPLT